MTNHGISLSDIFGKEYVSDGMSEDQIHYFDVACMAFDASIIDMQSLAFARAQGGTKENQKSMNKSVDDLRHIATKTLLKRRD